MLILLLPHFLPVGISYCYLAFHKYFCSLYMFSSLLKISPYSNFNHICIRHYLPDSTRLLGKVLYHALKQKLMPISYKVFFNNSYQTFELRDTK